MSTFISAHHQQFCTTTYIFYLVIMPSFSPEIEYAGISAPLIHFEEINCLMATAFYWKQRAAILTWTIRSVNIVLGKFRIFWTRTTLNHKKMLAKQLGVTQPTISITISIKNWYISRIINTRNRELIPANHLHLPQDQITSDGRRCCVFGRSSNVLSTISCWLNY